MSSIVCIGGEKFLQVGMRLDNRHFFGEQTNPTGHTKNMGIHREGRTPQGEEQGDGGSLGTDTLVLHQPSTCFFEG